NKGQSFRPTRRRGDTRHPSIYLGIETSDTKDQQTRLQRGLTITNSRRIREVSTDSAPAAIATINFFSLVNQLFGALLAFDMRMPPPTKGISTHETDTRNIAGRRSWVSNDALDPCTERPRNSVRDISAEGAFEFLRGVLAAAVCLSAT